MFVFTISVIRLTPIAVSKVRSIGCVEHLIFHDTGCFASIVAFVVCKMVCLLGCNSSCYVHVCLEVPLAVLLLLTL